MKKLIPFIKKYLQRSPYGWFGNYRSWEEAQSKTTGYDNNMILEKVRSATLKVKNGEAVYERDSVIFDKIQYSWPLLSVLMWIAAKNKGTLSVMDFGGSLGSTYFQNKKLLDGLQEVKWSIIEQKGFVECGSSDISDSKIQFFQSIDNAIQVRGMPDLLLVSCTLQYLEDPYRSLEQLLEYKIPYLLIDSTPFNYEAVDRITVQKIHPSIYEASYPCWFLNYNSVKAAIGKHYTILEEYMNELYIYLDGHKIQYRGILAALNS